MSCNSTNFTIWQTKIISLQNCVDTPPGVAYQFRKICDRESTLCKGNAKLAMHK